MVAYAIVEARNINGLAGCCDRGCPRCCVGALDQLRHHRGSVHGAVRAIDPLACSPTPLPRPAPGSAPQGPSAAGGQATRDPTQAVCGAWRVPCPLYGAFRPISTAKIESEEVRNFLLGKFPGRRRRRGLGPGPWGLCASPGPSRIGTWSETGSRSPPWPRGALEGLGCWCRPLRACVAPRGILAGSGA